MERNNGDNGAENRRSGAGASPPKENSAGKARQNDSPPLVVTSGEWPTDDTGAEALLKDPWFGDGLGSLFQARI